MPRSRYRRSCDALATARQFQPNPILRPPGNGKWTGPAEKVSRAGFLAPLERYRPRDPFSGPELLSPQALDRGHHVLDFLAGELEVWHGAVRARKKRAQDPRGFSEILRDALEGRGRIHGGHSPLDQVAQLEHTSPASALPASADPAACAKPAPPGSWGPRTAPKGTPSSHAPQARLRLSDISTNPQSLICAAGPDTDWES